MNDCAHQEKGLRIGFGCFSGRVSKSVRRTNGEKQRVSVSQRSRSFGIRAECHPRRRAPTTGYVGESNRSCCRTFICKTGSFDSERRMVAFGVLVRVGRSTFKATFTLVNRALGISRANQLRNKMRLQRSFHLTGASSIDLSSLYVITISCSSSSHSSSSMAKTFTTACSHAPS